MWDTERIDRYETVSNDALIVYLILLRVMVVVWVLKVRQNEREGEGDEGMCIGSVYRIRKAETGTDWGMGGTTQD